MAIPNGVKKGFRGSSKRRFTWLCDEACDAFGFSAHDDDAGQDNARGNDAYLCGYEHENAVRPPALHACADDVHHGCGRVHVPSRHGHGHGDAAQSDATKDQWPSELQRR